MNTAPRPQLLLCIYMYMYIYIIYKMPCYVNEVVSENKCPAGLRNLRLFHMGNA